MLSLNLYIHAAGVIAPDADPDEPVVRLAAAEPDYTGIIPPMQLRRMSKAVRTGIGAAHSCLSAAGIERPDAIAVGTAMGCLGDTEAFLRKMVAQEEQMLTPTAFIQSTHNTVAGQIALATGCHGYNTTIVQRGHSFEGAVMSAALYLGEQPEHTILTGGVDELTDTSLALMQRAGVYTKAPFAPADMLQAPHHRAIAGEGAGFVLLNKKESGAKAKLASLSTFTTVDEREALSQIQAHIAAAGGMRREDALWLGASGSRLGAEMYEEHLFARHNGPLRLFKARSGEWGTAVAAALARIILHWPDGAPRVWIVNHYGADRSVWLIERV